MRESTVTDPIERGVAVLLAFHGHNEPEQVEDLIEEVDAGNLTIFAGLRYPQNSPPLLVSDVKQFSEALLPINETRNYMMSIERLSGEKDKLAGNIANELIKDFQMATRYPPEERDFISAEELTQLVATLSTNIVSEREKNNVKE